MIPFLIPDMPPTETKMWATLGFKVELTKQHIHIIDPNLIPILEKKYPGLSFMITLPTVNILLMLS